MDNIAINTLVLSDTPRSMNDVVKEEDAPARGFENLALREQQFQDHSRLRSRGLYGPIINYTKANVGGGLLAIPLCFKLAGIFPSVFMIIGFALLNNFTAVSMVWVGNRLRLQDSTSVAKKVFGGKGSLTLNLCMLLKCFGSLVSYLIVIGGVIPSIFGGNAVVMGFELRTWLLLAICFFLLLPLSTLKNIDALRHGSAISLTIGVCLILIVMYRASSSLIAEGTMVMRRVGWFSGTLGTSGMIEAWSIMVYSFSSQHMTFPIYAELKPTPSMASFKTVSHWTNFVVAALYLICGFSGYLSFAESTQDNFLKNLSVDDGNQDNLSGARSYTEILRLLYSCTLVLSFQMNLHCARPCLSDVLSKGIALAEIKEDMGGDMSRVPRISVLLEGHGSEDQHRWVGYFLVGTSTAIAICVPELSLVLGLTGATTCTMIGFIFPALLMLHYDGKSALNYSEKLPALTLLAFGSIGGFLATLQIATAAPRH